VTSPSLPSDSRIILNLDNMLMPCGNWVAVDLTHTGLVNLTAIHLREANDYVQIQKLDQSKVQDQNDKRKQAPKDARRKH